ncbi:DUF4188 domain-containing protein [Parvibaculum sp. MBR-TMA-1.3b-4.2]|jgi:hypothetical protein
MSGVRAGRYTVISEEPFVVFLIGMRVNKLLRPGKWLPVARAMPRMLKELHADASTGFLGAMGFSYWRGGGLMQYWRSFEDLENYARAKGGTHVSAWAEFTRNVGDDGTVGIWHETYPVDPGSYECIYGNMPPFGLGGAMPVVPAKGAYANARERMRARGADMNAHTK